MGKRSSRQRPEDAGPLAAVEAALAGLRGRSADDLDDALYAAASTLTADPAGPEAVGRALLRAAEKVVRHAWEGGWQPADVARLVRRELTAAELRFTVDAVAAEARRYAPDTLSARWAAQLAELEARVWWEADDAFLEGFAGRERLSRFEAAACGLGALRLIGSLPRIGAAGPLPGAARPVGGAGTGRPAVAVEPRMLTRIRALLAKAESTEFAEEAEALSAKAQELMARYSLDEALLAAHATEPVDGPGAWRIGVEGPYEAAKALLLDAVAEANHCRSVWSSEFDFSTVVGFEADLELVELMYTSLLVQATTAMRRAGDDHHARGRSRRTRDFRQSFLIAYAARIRDRLTATAAAVVAEAAGGAGAGAAAVPAEVLPVLAARDVAVGESTERLFPTTTSHRLKGRDAEGWARGEAAADAARLR
ncbi:DUF2786 domain-containing protein [Streptomyces albireticuli]|uniref:DUF2786 domain-containing protein n=2 Tax=Streptomyces albireticuli TaxID=1940 RepID=UPI001E299209|nr:DUF2786 domain-containing protein [Streptomyces albireticuli]MCD9142710.1 DUF2786 domain-containing protein [Streptomyces albireticuli]MCD9162971.1 DUF2786 domain-containing protein [Streptomyces albireticuli]MCD9192838.1 DUF2786 domain-containing protein [Streptomyces albireticuli]